MKKSLIKVLSICFLVLITIACKGKITADVYLSDLHLLNVESEVLYTTATLELESPGEDNITRLKEILNL